MKVMKITAFVDESGTGGHDRIMLGSLVSRKKGWFGFAPKWRKLLKASEIEYSHLVEMENGKPPFESWDTHRTAAFLRQAGPLINRHFDFGLTVALDLQVYQNEYRAKLPDKQHKDSAYGLSARAIIEGVTIMAIGFFGRDIQVNFIFEDNTDFGDAKRIFQDCKEHLNDVKGVLGTISPDKKTHFGLQATDLITSAGRRHETSLRFTRRSGPPFLARASCPIFYKSLSEEEVLGYCGQAKEIGAEKRWAAKKRKLARKTG